MAKTGHDLRHLLALLACDVSIVRARLKARELGPSELLPPLLERLDEGLARALGDAEGSASPLPDRAHLLREVWDRFAHAGRLGPGSDLTADAPWHFPGSDATLHSLLLNLIENATKAAGAQKVRVEARSGFLRIENGGAQLPAELARMLNSGQSPRPGGRHGQGLGQIVSAAEELGLGLKVEIGEGLGTCFLLERGGPSAARVLLIEDDAGLREMLGELLRREGYAVDTQANPEPVPKENLWDAVVADLNLHGQPGDQVLAAFKRDHPDLMTILLTGEREAASRHYAGVDRTLIKPALDLLLETLNPLREGAR